MNIDDSRLIQDARGGSADALAALYRRYWPIAWQWAYALTGERSRADDLAQDAVLRGFRSLRTFDDTRPFRPWLKRVLLNVAADDLRRLRRGEVSESWLEDRARSADGAQAERIDGVVAAVRTLPPARRTVVVLHYWLDLPVDEIAALLDLPYGTVASRLSRGLAQLREALEEERV